MLSSHELIDKLIREGAALYFPGGIEIPIDSVYKLGKRVLVYYFIGLPGSDFQWHTLRFSKIEVLHEEGIMFHPPLDTPDGVKACLAPVDGSSDDITIKTCQEWFAADPDPRIARIRAFVRESAPHYFKIVDEE